MLLLFSCRHEKELCLKGLPDALGFESVRSTIYFKQAPEYKARPECILTIQSLYISCMIEKWVNFHKAGELIYG